MKSRTESLSAAAFGAPPVTIIKAAITAMAAVFAGILARKGRPAADVFTLSGHELRDIGLHRAAPGEPIAYDLLDLMPRGAFYGPRRQRWL